MPLGIKFNSARTVADAAGSRSGTLHQRLLAVIFFGLLAFGSASAQESGAFAEPARASSPGKSQLRSAKNLRLKGVLISGARRTALVNGRPVQEGDRVGGVEILAIEQREIRIRVDSQEFSVGVGDTFAGGSAANNVKRVAQLPARRSQQNQERPAVLSPAPSRDSAVAHTDERRRHAVTAGETLSGIALRYMQDGVTMDQMMMELFDSNPHAFNDNINMLYEGAVLRIPGEYELDRHTPAMAAAEVARHADRWQPYVLQPSSVADSSPPRQDGPVESGETLSAIASRVLHDGVTINQMMIALYQSNPEAFSDNINVLYEGAVLRIPDETELRRQTPETATAEVVRQTDAWEAGLEQNARLAPPETHIMASVDVPTVN